MEERTWHPVIVTSGDGSHTLRVEALKENYHSHKGALQESLHVFIGMGLKQFTGAASLKILEVGFGTGLNALLTALNLESRVVEYTALEAYPLSREVVCQLNYPGLCSDDRAEAIYSAIHETPWNQRNTPAPGFALHKLSQTLQSFETEDTFDLVYFDAFAPHAQPELWELAIWQKIHRMMRSGGILVTYCAKGQVRRDMQAAGFEVERLAGPPGKREMIRARKT